MTDANAAEIEFRLLGPVEAVRNGSTLPLGGPRQRALLALLLLEAGRPISTDRLVDELWHGQPPAGASITLPSYVSRLRAVLGTDAVITSSGSGYALEVLPDQVDTSRFERLAAEGREALARGAASRAAKRLRAALDLWRGRPLAELGDEGALRLEADRLEELRLLTLEERIEADLQLGGGAGLVEEVEALVHEHPYRERLWRQLMLALYRAQRQADALAAYQRARSILDEALGLEPSDELKRLEQAILRQDVPVVQPPEERHNLPAAVTSFIGREKELAEIERLLGEARLVTLTGVGGAGKTRLALEAATRAVPDFPDGVFFVDFSALTEPALVARHVASALDVQERADVGLAEQLVSRLRETELLLALDNCEHLREACAELCHTLLTAAPRLRILTTSREVLGAPGEIDFLVPPLTVAPRDADPDELRRSEAVQLFLARAHAARPRLSDDDRAITTAAGICADLDGLPLAIELAAARAKALSLEDIATRLSDRFRFLVSWRRLAAARHRTLREAMDWSYDLLSADEQALLARLSVFAGGFTLAAASGVSVEGDDERTLELIERLVDASLVIAEERDGEMRYRLLETVRQYAAERLDACEETSVSQRRHAEYFMAMVEEAWDLQVANLDRWLELLGSDYDNLRAALAWSRDADAPEYLLRLAKAIWRFWWVRGFLDEGRGWLDAALERGDALEPALQAEALEGAAALAWAHADLERASALAERAQRLFTGLGDRRGELASLNVLGLVALSRADFPIAERLFERSRELAEELEIRSDVAVLTHNLGSVALAEGDLERAARRYEVALALYRAEDSPYGVALSELYLGLVAVESGRCDDAASYLGRALPVFREMGFLQYAAQCVDGIAAVANARGRAHDAVRLLAAASALRERTGDSPTVGARLRKRETAATQAVLGESSFAAAWAEGLALAEPEAFERAQLAVTG